MRRDTDTQATHTIPKLQNPSPMLMGVEWYDPVKPGQPPEWGLLTRQNSKRISMIWRLMVLWFVSWVAFGGGIVLVLICILVGGPWMFASLVAGALIAAVTYPAVKLLRL